MTTGRSLSLAAVLTITGAVALLAYLYRHQLLELAVLVICARVSWHLIGRKVGVKRRPKSSWSALGRTGAIMYAAWNSRWLKPTVKASIPASAANPHDRPEGWDR